jgi:hypothetical protein
MWTVGSRSPFKPTAVTEAQASTPNNAVLVTAARLRFLLNLNGHGWAAARDGGRWAAEAKETRQSTVTRDQHQPAGQQGGPAVPVLRRTGRSAGLSRGWEQDPRPGRTYPRYAAQPTAAPHRRLLATLLNVKGFVWAARGERER